MSWHNKLYIWLIYKDHTLIIINRQPDSDKYWDYSIFQEKIVLFLCWIWIHLALSNCKLQKWQWRNIKYFHLICDNLSLLELQIYNFCFRPRSAQLEMDFTSKTQMLRHCTIGQDKCTFSTSNLHQKKGTDSILIILLLYSIKYRTPSNPVTTSTKLQINFQR